MASIEFNPLPPAEAVAFFRAKGFRLGFAWQDVWQDEHARAFTVAKAMRLDILEDIRRSVDNALAQGTTFQTFKKQLTPVLQSKGWWGRQLAVDPLTGETRAVQLGSIRRLRTIFDVNLRTSYAAGRWEQIERLKKRRPWLRYSAVRDNRTRPDHRAWHGTVLPVDDPWWDTHYPPNGWRCRCTPQQLSDRDLKRRGLAATPRPTGLTRRYVNKRTGEVTRVPQGIDPGWSYNVGKAHMRGLVPPPAGGALDVPFKGPAASVAMPPIRTAPSSRLLESDLTDDAYVARFLKEFGAAPGKPKIFTDAIGEDLVISEALFTGAGNVLKVAKRGRERHLLLLADTIRDPDEIWWQWVEYPKGNMTLIRRYLARWEITGQTVPALTYFAVSKAGWSGVTAFPADRENYLLKRRSGTLAFHRTK